MRSTLIQVQTGNGETRWINLDQVSRVSLVPDADGGPLLAFMFAGGDKVTIHGTDPYNQDLIQRVVAQVEEVTTHGSAA